MITLLAAVSKNNKIGKGDELPWRIPTEMKHFREVTEGNICIIGRKTCETLTKPLKNRIVIAVSKTCKLVPNATMTVPTLGQALDISTGYNLETFICGGRQLYIHGEAFAHRLLISHIFDEYEGDVDFPIMLSNWKMHGGSVVCKDFVVADYRRK